MTKTLGALVSVVLVVSAAACDDDPVTSPSVTAPDAGAQPTPDGGAPNQQPPIENNPAPEQGLYVVDYRGAIVHMSLEDGTIHKTYGTQGSGEHQFVDPTGIAATKKHLYIADQGNLRLVRLARLDGAGWKAWSPGAGIEPYGVAALLSDDEKEENVVFSDYTGMQFLYAPADLEGAPKPGAKLKFNTCGVAIKKGGAAGSSGCSSGPALNTIVHPQNAEQVYTGGLNRPDGLAYLPDGTLVIADTGNNRVVCVNGASAGDFGKAGSEGDLAFQAISAVTTDLRGRIYVADTTNAKIVRVDDCEGTNPKVLWQKTDAIDQITALAAVGPYMSARRP